MREHSEGSDHEMDMFLKFQNRIFKHLALPFNRVKTILLWSSGLQARMLPGHLHCKTLAFEEFLSESEVPCEGEKFVEGGNGDRGEEVNVWEHAFFSVSLGGGRPRDTPP